MNDPILDSIFYKTFIGEYVFLLTAIMTSKAEVHDEQMIEVNKPIKLLGYLLDMDSEYYYVGETPNKISQAIKIQDVCHVEIAEFRDSKDELLDRFDIPNDPTEIN